MELNGEFHRLRKAKALGLALAIVLLLYLWAPFAYEPSYRSRDRNIKAFETRVLTLAQADAGIRQPVAGPELLPYQRVCVLREYMSVQEDRRITGTVPWGFPTTLQENETALLFLGQARTELLIMPMSMKVATDETDCVPIAEATLVALPRRGSSQLTIRLDRRPNAAP